MTTSLVFDLFQELSILSKCYTGCPSLTGEHWFINPASEQPTLVLLLRSDGTEVSPSPISAGTDWLKISHESAPLAIFPDADGYVDSNEVLRCLNVYLSTLKDYKTSHISIPGIQVFLENLSQQLCLLPTIPVDNKEGERIYYLVANGQGNWQRLYPDQIEA